MTQTVNPAASMPPFFKTVPAVSRPWRYAIAAGGVGLLAAAGAFFWHGQGAPVVLDGQQAAGRTADLLSAEQRANLCTSANAVGVGLRGEYFAGEAGQGEPLLMRVDSPVDFDASLDWPAHLADRRPQSARWSGWIKPPLTGAYRFHADAPGLRISVAKQVVAGQGAVPNAPIELTAGRFYPILMELSDVGPGMGRVRLEWTAPHGARYLVPRSLLFLPTESVAASPGS